MPDATEHLIGGAASAGLVYFLTKKSRQEIVEGGELLRWIIGGALGAALPDQLEPPTGVYHRRTMHSETILVGSGWLWNKIQTNPNLDQSSKDFLSAATLGYASHLALDAGTKAGIPLI